MEDSFSGKPRRSTVVREKQVVIVLNQLKLGDVCHHNITQPTLADTSSSQLPLAPLLSPLLKACQVFLKKHFFICYVKKENMSLACHILYSLI